MHYFFWADSIDTDFPKPITWFIYTIESDTMRHKKYLNLMMHSPAEQSTLDTVI
jgi:hypothetical protein